jgi:hypothetical protein
MELPVLLIVASNRIKGIVKQDLEERKPVERHSLFDNPTWPSETVYSK